MKSMHLVSLTFISMLLVHCSNPEPVATGYKKSLQSADAGAESDGGGNTPAGDGNTQTGGNSQGAGSNTPAGGGTAPAAGNETKGLALISDGNCKGCHPAAAGGLAINAAIIPRLGNALTGSAAGSHKLIPGTAVALSAENRADLEAGIKAAK